MTNILIVGVFMGAFSYSALDNDDAMDWICELRGTDLKYEKIVSAIKDYDDYLIRKESGNLIAPDNDEVLENNDELIEYFKNRHNASSEDVNKIIEAIKKYDEDNYAENSDDYAWNALAAIESLLAFVGNPSEEFLEIYSSCLSIDYKKDIIYEGDVYQGLIPPSILIINEIENDEELKKNIKNIEGFYAYIEGLRIRLSKRINGE
ncbi:DUF4259 domain-containing protein [Marinobacterium sp. D7]|uniref:DUF4259 domain-containing protein n=1 Tax=Marinobacterium ramblicola TaxID=2849041 RepID=UPI001C2D3B54|nr:DUF4259 domain-containing protein [Marinobacterium ramblicola]MBV1790820.1 DUF4259 domain-containing protein [Marinobacterium ramblicola]